MNNLFSELAVIYVILFAFINFILCYVLFLRGSIGQNITGLVTGILGSFLGAMMEWTIVSLLFKDYLDKILIVLGIIIIVVFFAFLIRMLFLVFNKKDGIDKNAYIYDLIAMMFCVMLVLLSFSCIKNEMSVADIISPKVAEADPVDTTEDSAVSTAENSTVDAATDAEVDSIVDVAEDSEVDTMEESVIGESENITDEAIDNSTDSGEFVASGYAEDFKADVDIEEVEAMIVEAYEEKEREETIEAENKEAENKEAENREAENKKTENTDAKNIDAVNTDLENTELENVNEEKTDSAKTVIENRPAATENVYILPESNIKYITEDDLAGFTKTQCMIARNELYARYGRIFTNEVLKDHFERQQWYNPQYAPEVFNEGVLSEIEKANRDVIVAYERKMGYR